MLMNESMNTAQNSTVTAPQAFAQDENGNKPGAPALRTRGCGARRHRWACLPMMSRRKAHEAGAVVQVGRALEASGWRKGVLMATVGFSATVFPRVLAPRVLVRYEAVVHRNFSHVITAMGGSAFVTAAST